ncbi:hypothetical protein [Aureimonas leprariae]|uniref:Uncharacterized protein n=1 Tax=Plantimonas leprariae TaxID=2615207 RepID=A0A7V7PT04_9HYPH|nr:hypothetical protein [Aureimonas leprariae]KAB0682775.1 hypothetical protein F6X38_01455 [Aureimonas leprariae]
MTSAESQSDSPPLAAEWPFPVAAALGSAVRATGIEREIRARLPWGLRNCLAVASGCIALRMPDGEAAEFAAARAIVATALEGIAALPVLPGEVEDILTISARERLKWTRDGRLRSAGTRTVKLRGRAKAVTFHVFDPRHVEDVLDRDLPTIWREEDAAAIRENRKRAAGKAARTRAGEGKAVAGTERRAPSQAVRPRLQGWEAFETEGLLR